MQVSKLFLNEVGRLRSGWRVGIFFVGFIVLLVLFELIVYGLFATPLFARSSSGPELQHLATKVADLAAALLAGWLCNYGLEGLPWRALGLSLHPLWWRDLLIGTLIGAVSLGIAVLLSFLAGGVHFSFAGRAALFPVLRALVGTAVLFIIAGMAEEAAFRGYPLQTLTRAKLIWFAIFLTSVPFGAAHLGNRGATLFSTLNTILAGVWLAAAYLKTRSLWFPIGVHWAWNWALGSIFGLAVSGMRLSGHPLLQAIDRGPVWLTGGAYGIEGGAACTIALLISTLLIWQTRLVSATPDLLQLTAEENPVRVPVRQT